jgi:hypothetical protein
MSRRRQSTSRPLTRLSAPVTLPGATEYSDDPALNGPLTLISRVKGLGHLYTRLRDDVRIAHNWGPRRSPGDWALVMFEFTVSGLVDIEPWYHQRYENTSFWKACGFRHRPSKSLVYERLLELEAFAGKFDRLADHLIGLAARKDPNVGRWLHVDGTEAETHAVPRHDCQPGDDCPTAGQPTLERLERLDTAGARRLRHAEATRPTDTIPDTGAAAEPRADVEESDIADLTGGGRRFRSGGHWWVSRDPTAGTRKYTSKGKVVRLWHGFYLIVTVDHYTGAMLSARIQSASIQEFEGYAPSIERVSQAVGRAPLAVVADRGFSFPRVFEYNTRRGIASVMPYRRQGGKNSPLTPKATERWDEQGIPFCQHCGGGSDFVKFFIDRGMPRIWYRCTLPQIAACQPDQSINCALDFARLRPLWETHEAYAILSEAHSEYERIHDLNRDRYRIGPDCLRLRPKRLRAGWQQLRASAAVAIEWLRVCFRQGWLGSRGRHTEPRQRTSKRVFEQTLETRAKLRRWGGGIAGRRSRAGPAPPG